MVKWLAFFALAAGLAGNAGSATVYDEALAAYWHEDNLVTFEKCVAVIRARPADADAAHALYLMEVICTTKLNFGMGTQKVERLQQTWQELLYEEFSQATVPTEKDRLAQKLASLWRDGNLANELKEKIAQEHFRLVLHQLERDYPAWEARDQHTFPFPDVWTEFTPTLYVNGQSRGAIFGSSAHSMFVTNNPIASMSGGEFKNGDVLQCKVQLRQGKQWQTTLWTSKIVLENLRQ